jgi:hypothetical protein
MKTPEERFWAKVNKTEDCWLWTAGLNQVGYGHFCLEKKPVKAHRISLEWSLGRPIGEGLVARHKCRNRNCVNPEHLEEGTKKENSQDMIRDGTSTRGTKNSKCKLTEQQVLAIRVDQRPQKEIAEEYGISLATVSQIKTGRSWSWLSDQESPS